MTAGCAILGVYRGVKLAPLGYLVGVVVLEICGAARRRVAIRGPYCLGLQLRPRSLKLSVPHSPHQIWGVDQCNAQDPAHKKNRCRLSSKSNKNDMQD